MGLPASGKSTLASKLREALVGSEIKAPFDDASSPIDGAPETKLDDPLTSASPTEIAPTPSTLSKRQAPSISICSFDDYLKETDPRLEVTELVTGQICLEPSPLIKLTPPLKPSPPPKLTLL